MVPGSTCVTRPVNSIGSSLGKVEFAASNASRCSGNQPIFAVKIVVDICGGIIRLAKSVMKSDMTNTILTLVLAVLVLAGVLLTLQTILRTREFGSMSAQVNFARNSLLQEQALFNDCLQYSKTHPDMNRVLQPFEAKPVAR